MGLPPILTLRSLSLSRGPMAAMTGDLHPTLIYSRNSDTASVARSLHNRLTDGTLGYFHPHSSPILPHSLLGGPDTTLSGEVMARLPLAAVTPRLFFGLQLQNVSSLQK